MINFKWTKQLYNIAVSRCCTLTLQNTTFSLNTTVLTLKSQFRLALHAYASCLAKVWPNYVIFPILFQVWSKTLSPISNRAVHSTFKTCRGQLPKKLLKVYFLRGSSKAYSLYKVYTTLHFTVPDKKVQLCSLRYRGTQRQFSEKYLFGRRFDI